MNLLSNAPTLTPELPSLVLGTIAILNWNKSVYDRKTTGESAKWLTPLQFHQNKSTKEFQINSFSSPR